jgi:vesicle-associated membrane protein 7
MSDVVNGLEIGNFELIARRILDKISPGQDQKRQYKHETYCFNYVVSGGITFLALANDDFPTRLAFAFLEDIRQQFLASYGDRSSTAVAYQMNEFNRILRKQMEYYSSDPSADRIRAVDQQLSEVKEIMVDNMARLLERGEKIEVLQERTDRLSRQAHQFHRQGRALRYEYLWRNIMITLVIVGIVAVVLFILFFVIVLFACDGPFLPRCIAFVDEVINQIEGSSSSSSSS